MPIRDGKFYDSNAPARMAGYGSQLVFVFKDTIQTGDIAGDDFLIGELPPGIIIHGGFVRYDDQPATCLLDIDWGTDATDPTVGAVNIATALDVSTGANGVVALDAVPTIVTPSQVFVWAEFNTVAPTAGTNYEVVMFAILHQPNT